MSDKKRFEKFVEKLIAEADTTGVNWYYKDGTPMTEDAREFLKHYRQMVIAWETIVTMSENSAVILEPKRR